MTIRHNPGDGIQVNNSLFVQDSMIAKNGGAGIECVGMCHIESSMIAYNGLQGVKTGPGSTVLGNTIFMNGGLGIEGSKTGFGNNTIHANKPPQVTGGIKLQPNACVPACP